MILSTLSLSPHGFALGLYPKGLIPMEIFVHPYIPMILPVSSQCGTLVVYLTDISKGLFKINPVFLLVFLLLFPNVAFQSVSKY